MIKVVAYCDSLTCKTQVQLRTVLTWRATPNNRNFNVFAVAPTPEAWVFDRETNIYLCPECAVKEAAAKAQLAALTVDAATTEGVPCKLSD